MIKNNFKFILNFSLTIFISFIIYGYIGIIISFIPDVMLIFCIGDLKYGKNKNRLFGKKLNIHLFLHSLTFIFISIITCILFLIINLFSIVEVFKINGIFLIHILLDYITHSRKDNKYFIGYYLFYPYKKIKIR